MILFLLPLLVSAQLNFQLSGRGQPQDEPDDGTRIFALPVTRDTRELAATAEEHLRAGRYPEAIQALERILEEHAQEVLPGESGTAANPSTYPGAAEWALERLFGLPETARAEYRARYGPRANEALARARRAPTRSALVAIARRWPLVSAAVQAWWTLGDLELEAGQIEMAALAWRRGQRLSERLGLAPDAAAAATRLAWLGTHASEPATRPAGALATLPRGDAEPWTAPLDLTPFPPRASPMLGRNLQPIRSGDLVLVGTTLRLYALDAFTGEPRWQAGPPRGWGTLGAPLGSGLLFEGINYEQLFLAPAAGDGVAVTVLQEPFTENDNEDWQGIPIMTAIPERRLHAFDLASGRELWNHAPKLTSDGRRQHWDGSGTYGQRMMVAGSPIVLGARVLVPCYRMQGRIDYHVACYELHSGELLWSTLVISGQRERNMFGRPVREFSATPLVVSGDRVLAQTELGTLAALDLFTGRIQWQTTYRQLPLPKTRNYNAPPRPLTWERLAPPVVVGNTVVSAPSDSNELMAVRLEDGSKLWAFTEEWLQARNRETELLGFNLFLGADQDAVYLSGAKLSALTMPGGIASGAPFEPRWTKRLDRPDTSPRPLLLDEVVLAPNAVGRTAFDRRTGAPLGALSGSWSRGEAGCLWAADGALFSLSNQGLSGYFDWEAQLERARRAARKEASPESLRAAAELFRRRGELCLAESSLEGARAALEEARGYYARLGATNTGDDARGRLEAARSLADVLARLMREREALAVLTEARGLAQTRAELAGVLFQEERLLRVRGGPARIEILDEIEACWGAWSLPEDAWHEAAARWLASTPEGASGIPDPSPIPTVLWVALERAEEYQRLQNRESALEELHAALAGAGSLVLARGFPLATLVRGRISEQLALPGGREAYAPLEARAAAQLEAARQNDDDAGLEALCESYPHAHAADEAMELLLSHALEGSDVRAVSALVSGALARGGLSEERETQLLLVLARALGRAGNAAFERGLVTALAQTHPTSVSDLAGHDGHTLTELAAELMKEAVEPLAAPVRFDGSVVANGRQRPGAAVYVGTLRREGQVAEDGPFELQLYAMRDELLAYASSAPGSPLWKHALAQPLDAGARGCVAARGRFTYATRSTIVALDADGDESWSADTPEDPTRALGESNGVLLSLSRAGTVQARDARLGMELWERPLGEAGRWTGPVLGDGHAVFFSQLPSLPPRVLVLDLYRGTTTADLRLSGFDSRSALEDSAWIAEGRLIAPSFQIRPAQLAAFELEGGRRAWTVEFGRDEDFQSVVHCEEKSYPITLAAALGTSGNGGVYELDPRAGTLRRVVPLKAGERLMGIAEGESVWLDSPYLFTFTYSDTDRSVPIRAIHLPYGMLWTWSLPVSSQEIYDGRNLPRPAVSADCVALAYQMRRANAGQGAETTIVFLDKRAGKKVDTLLLGGAFSQANRLELRGLGEALLVLGMGAPKGACLEVLEKLR